MKRCGRCQQWKVISEYNKNKSTLDGYYCYCKDCSRVLKRDSYERNKKRSAAKSRRQRYNVSASQFALIKGRQDEACAICREPLRNGKKTHLDHCHQTGRVRGILCAGCNIGLGAFKDDPVRINHALTYLKGRPQVPKENRLFELDGDGAAC